MENVTVITGGTSGIGKAIVNKIQSCSDENDKIIVVYGHSEDNAKKLVEESAKPEQIILIKADMSEYESINGVVEQIKEHTDHIDWLVLNTGIGTYAAFDEYTCEIWDKVMRTNINVPAMFVKTLKPMMAENGNILFMGSIMGEYPHSSSLVYGVSKAAVHFLAKSLVKCFADKKVCVNAVAPGFTETRWHSERTDESRERINRKIAAHRFGDVAEIAELSYAVLNNDYMNGGIYDVHGGYDFF